MLKLRSPQASFYGSYLYDRIVPQDHLLRKINQVVDFSFVRGLVIDRYDPDFGRPAEDPEFMVRLCLLQYLYGDSDRRVIENAKLNLAYKYFLGLSVDEDVPDDTTICYFRAIRLGEDKFQQVFEAIVKQCIDKGLVTGKKQIIDSTHIIADMAVTSLTGLITLCRRNVLKDIATQNSGLADKLSPNKVVATKVTKFAKAEDSLEEEVTAAKELLDKVSCELNHGGILPTLELKKDLELLEKAVADRREDATDRLVSPIDPDARMGKKEHKSWAGYKGHVVVEEDTEIITAVSVTPGNKDDGSQLRPLLNQQEEALALTPASISADKAYGAGANLDYLSYKNIMGTISLRDNYNRKGTDLFGHDDFVYDTIHNTLTCPAGQMAPHRKRDLVFGEGQRRSGTLFQFTYAQCGNCQLKPLCYTSSSKTHGRAVHISIYEPLFQQMKDRMNSEEGKEAYRNRYRIEHKIADLARYCGMRRCRYRGLTRAGIHTLLAAIASNVKRMANLLWRVPEQAPMAV
jgi:transposase